MLDRTSLLLQGVSPDARIVEVGPSYGPVAPKAGGWQTTVVDHANRESLVATYVRDPSVDTMRIEEVDLIWTGGPLHDSFPPASHGGYSALIASHVLEHIPDPIGFFKSAEVLLHGQGGTLRLALPDRRLCFDVFRPTTTTGRVLAAHRQHTGRHGYADLFDHVAYLARIDGRAAWTSEPLMDLALDHTLEQAYRHAEHGSASGGTYVDCHAWQFTPASFELLILELSALGIIDWRVDWIEPQPYTEFLVSLSRPRLRFDSPDDLQRMRCTLLKRTILEMRDVADRLLASG